VLSGNTVGFTAAGTVKITASQGGNGSYAPAASVEQDIQVVPATLLVTAPAATRIYEAPYPAFAPSITGFVPPDTQASIVTGSPTFTVSSGLLDSPVGTVQTVTTALGTLALLSSNYTFAVTPSTLTVACCEAQTFVPATIPPANMPVPVGTTISLSVFASSGLPVTYSPISGPGTLGTDVYGGTTLTVTGTGAVTVQASQAGNGNVSAAVPINLTFVGH
jgi:hypothetical protein